MTSSDLTTLAQDIASIPLARPAGRVSEVEGSVIQVSGLSNHAEIGDRLVLQRPSGESLAGEVLRISRDHVYMLADGTPEGVAIGNLVVLRGTPEFRPCDAWVGRVIDPFGLPMDGAPLLKGREPRSVVNAPPHAALRRPLGARMPTGLAVLNTMLPIVKGQRVGLFAGSGVGKSTLLAQLARSMQADKVVLALIGERGREVNEFVNQVLGAEGMKRAVVVAATADQSALVRRRCAAAAMTVAEHFRDKGETVLFLADSITRFAEAHREVASAQGEAPALRGFPPSVVPQITGLCERAGPGQDGQGDITAVFSVLVAASDMDEPVADILRGVLDGHVVLNREIAERGRYPAIDVARSVSRSLPAAANDAENQMIQTARKFLGAYEQSETMIRAGLYAEGSDPVLDVAIKLWPELDAFFSRMESDNPNEVQSSFDRLGLILRRAGAG